MIVNARTMRELVWSVVRPQEVVVDRSPTGLVTARVVGSGVFNPHGSRLASAQ